MILLALDVYGIRPFKKAKRILLKPGLNAILGENGTGKTMIYQALSALLFNTPSDHIAFFEDQTQQAAVTFSTSNNEIYRIARNFKKGLWNLSKKEAVGNKFTTIETTSNKIYTWLKTTTGGLEEDERALLFMLDSPRLPSRQLMQNGVKNLPLPGRIAAPSSQEPAQAPERSAQEQTESNALFKQQEAALKTAQKKLDTLAETDDEMFAKQDKAAEIQKRIASVSELKDKIKQMQAAETERFSHFSAETLINPQQIKHFESDEKTLADDFETFEMEGEGLEAALMIKKQETQKKNPLKILGLFLVISSFLLPFVVPLSGLFRYIFLGGVLSGSALSGFAYFKRFQRTAAQNNLEKKLLHLDECVRKSEQKFERTHTAIYLMIKKTDSKNLAELKTQQNAYRNLQEKKEAAQTQVDLILNGETPATLLEKTKNLEAEVETLREQLKGHQELSEEVYRLQETLRDSEAKIETSDSTFSDLPSLDLPVQVGEGSFFSGLLDIGENGTRPSRERLEHDAGILYRRLRPQNSDLIQIANNGEIKVGATALHHLSPGLADQVFLSLVLSSLSQFSNVACPLFLDEPFETLDPASREAVMKILQVIAKKRQVIFFTSHPEFAQEKQIISL